VTYDGSVNVGWGDIDEEDKRENEFAVGEQLRIFQPMILETVRGCGLLPRLTGR
jgi:hypothetical protein